MGTDALIVSTVDEHETELIALRRDLHAHPELAWEERRTTAVVAERLAALGWAVDTLPLTGLLAELGEGERTIALRADMDALPVADETGDPWASTVPGVAHACGHDVHVSALVGAATALAEVRRRGLLAGRVRLLLQPAEEVMPGGALHLIEHGAIAGVERIFALHADPGVDAGLIGLREGSLTSATDLLEVRLTGPGGHTSRPHLTADLTFALAKLTTELPAVLSRRMDPRAGVSVVWGVIQAGSAANVIPQSGRVAGTVRILDATAWAAAEQAVAEAVADLVHPYGVKAEVDYRRGVPPVVNDADSYRLLQQAVKAVLGPAGHVATAQSLGGEDFGWYLDRIPGAMLRLGTRTPGGATYDLHQGNLRIDETAVAVGAKVLAGAVVQALVI